MAGDVANDFNNSDDPTAFQFVEVGKHCDADGFCEFARFVKFSPSHPAAGVNQDVAALAATMLPFSVLNVLA